jgi:hypothetical protein
MIMYLRRCALALGLLAACLAQAATVYKWTDADGVVHYSDQPAPGSVEVQTDSGPTGFSTAQGPPLRVLPTPKPMAAAAAGTKYQQFAIASPAASQGFYAEPVPVRLNLSPGLLPGDSLTWTLNGKALDDRANSREFTLDELPRGTYVLSATITDPSTNETQSAPPVTFYMQEPSKLSPQHKN